MPKGDQKEKPNGGFGGYRITTTAPKPKPKPKPTPTTQPQVPDNPSPVTPPIVDMPVNPPVENPNPGVLTPIQGGNNLGGGNSESNSGFNPALMFAAKGLPKRKKVVIG